MPRFLVDIEVRAIGRSPLHQTPEVEAEDAVDAVTIAATAIPAGDWGDAQITGLRVFVDLLTADQKP